MRTMFWLAVGVLLTSGCSMKMDDKSSKKEAPKVEKQMAHVHIDHVMTGWHDTPSKNGLLPTAISEAEIASKFADVAAEKPEDLTWMKTNISNVLHAIDPKVEKAGAGHGYGVRKAAEGAAKHTEFAAASKGASKNVKTLATHVKTSARNAGLWANLIVKLGKRVQTANSAAEAAPLVRKIKTMANALIAGIDANGDGVVSWKKGEGGLAVAKQNMGLMIKGEGLVISSLTGHAGKS